LSRCGFEVEEKGRSIVAVFVGSADEEEFASVDAAGCSIAA
jgi:hypothetical protein